MMWPNRYRRRPIRQQPRPDGRLVSGLGDIHQNARQVEHRRHPRDGEQQMELFTHR